MKLATYNTSSAARGAPAGMSLPPGAFWAQFGREVLVLAEEAQWGEVVNRASRSAIRLQERRGPATRERLYVVVQNGRLFEQDHADVPVLLNHGRLLLVDIDPERARRLDSLTCYGLLPLADNQVVFETRDTAGARVVPEALIQALVDDLSHRSLEASLTHLVAFPTRHSTSTHYTKASAWARRQLKAMHYTTRMQTVRVGGSTSRNVIAEKLGSGATPQVVMVTAHLDSINLRGGPAASAPGADDNASGSAGVLEMARVFQHQQGEHDLRFILFGGEEQGLFGSQRYVASLSAAERARIRAVINMDMIGTLNSTTQGVLLEGAPLSQRLIEGLHEAAATYTQLAVDTSLHPFASDHVPFIDAGIPAVLTIEGADSANSNIHSGRDTIEHIDYDFALEILRMNVAFVASTSGGRL
jgi:Peptidase family M28